MNIAIRQRWTAALRSGEYQQGRSCLRQLHQDGSVTWCCLGVLCDLYAQEHGIDWDVSMGDSFIAGEMAVLPPEVRDWAELDASNPEIVPNNSATLAEFNDQGMPFPKIAEMIDNYL